MWPSRTFSSFFNCLPLLLISLFGFSGSANGETSRVLQFSIEGTEFKLSAFGLPEKMEGIIFHSTGPKAGAVAGTYSETIQPHIDPKLGFIGAQGVSTFTLYDRENGNARESKIVIHNQSQIVGEVPSNASLLVESLGEVKEAQGAYKGFKGVMATEAEVRLGANPFLKVNVTLSEKDPKSPWVPAVGGKGEGRLVWSSFRHQNQAAKALLVQFRADGKIELRYSPQFRARIISILLKDKAPSPDVLSAQTGIASSVLARWATEARLLKKLSAPNPLLNIIKNIKGTGIDTKLKILSEASRLKGKALEDYLKKEKIKPEDFKKWREAVEKALKEVSSQPIKKEPGKEESKSDSQPNSQSGSKTNSPPPKTGLKGIGEALKKLTDKKT